MFWTKRDLLYIRSILDLEFFYTNARLYWINDQRRDNSVPVASVTWFSLCYFNQQVYIFYLKVKQIDIFKLIHSTMQTYFSTQKKLTINVDVTYGKTLWTFMYTVTFEMILPYTTIGTWALTFWILILDNDADRSEISETE